MAYTTVETVRNVLMSYYDLDEPGSSVNADKLTDAQIEYAILNAESQINAAIRRRYDVPFSAPVPELLVVISTDIAATLSDLTFRGSAPYTSALNPMRLRYERAKSLLDQVAGGTLDLLNVSLSDMDALYNPDKYGFLSVYDVFPRGLPCDPDRAEYAERQIPYRYLRPR